MTKAKCLEVLDRYERMLSAIRPHKKDREMVEHLRSMIPRMREMLAEDFLWKFMRWLGFMQGVLWQRKWFTLEDLKKHNRPLSKHL